MRILLSALAILIGTEISADDLADYQSRDFATEAREALRTGDRTAAIVAALKGLPKEPDDNDLARFGDAYEVLVRAAISRSVRLDLPVMSVFEFDGTGTRLRSVSLTRRRPVAKRPGTLGSAKCRKGGRTPSDRSLDGRRMGGAGACILARRALPCSDSPSQGCGRGVRCRIGCRDHPPAWARARYAPQLRGSRFLA